MALPIQRVPEAAWAGRIARQAARHKEVHPHNPVIRVGGVGDYEDICGAGEGGAVGGGDQLHFRRQVGGRGGEP